eukprot:360098-Chlamydomonas_euryale.AAC.4
MQPLQAISRTCACVPTRVPVRMCTSTSITPAHTSACACARACAYFQAPMHRAPMHPCTHAPMPMHPCTHAPCTCPSCAFSEAPFFPPGVAVPPPTTHACPYAAVVVVVVVVVLLLQAPHSLLAWLAASAAPSQHCLKPCATTAKGSSMPRIRSCRSE